MPRGEGEREAKTMSHKGVACEVVRHEPPYEDGFVALLNPLSIYAW